MKDYIEIINYLNLKTGKSFRSTTKKTKSLIRARMREGFEEQDFYKVIDVKANQWLGTDFEKYLRPETLFGTKFESYLNENETGNNQEELFRASDYYKAI